MRAEVLENLSQCVKCFALIKRISFLLLFVEEAINREWIDSEVPINFLVFSEQD